MADPRDDVNNVGTGFRTETFKIDNSTITHDDTKVNGSDQVGLAVTLSAADTVELVGVGEAVEGKLLSVSSDDKCSVQVAGVMTLPAGTGATLTLGEKIVGGLLVAAEGYIRVVATVTAAELGHAKGSIQDASVITAVVVRLP